ncbi:baeRF3 domain-containing protein [Actinacidiphila oryziradicis]|uniref:Chemotaxis protein n=1 Tax=Actinacidiphila oryziradicis TaxID=2571141 RepID=A0A4U0SWH4_9ACTN|nr:chemotaxis protein [Actinacidiphila oryziradicis]TKA13051.1 chemotaxis protein [Actinacidiphila oryziradicis]
MRITDLTSDTLAALRAPRPYPAVTVALPTHRRNPLSQEDPVRLRNLVTQAKQRLETDPAVTREARFEVSGQLDQAAAEVDFRHTLDGLLIFAAQGEHQVWDSPRSVPERIVFSDTYETRNLVAARKRAQPYWVLAVALDRTTLWSGTDDSVTEAPGQGFPMEPDRPDPDPENLERAGERLDPLRGETARRYFRQVDNALQQVLAEDPRPLYLVGLPQELSLLDDVGTAVKDATDRVHVGGLAHGPGSALAAELRPAFEAQVQRDLQRVAQRFEEARNRKTFTTGLDEVWQTVQEGRIDLLAVEDSFEVAACISGGHLIPVDSEAATGLVVREDTVDEIIERTLDFGGEVVFVPDGVLAAHDRIAAALRY